MSLSALLHHKSLIPLRTPKLALSSLFRNDPSLSHGPGADLTPSRGPNRHLEGQYQGERPQPLAISSDPSAALYGNVMTALDETFLPTRSCSAPRHPCGCDRHQDAQLDHQLEANAPHLSSSQQSQASEGAVFLRGLVLATEVVQTHQ